MLILFRDFPLVDGKPVLCIPACHFPSIPPEGGFLVMGKEWTLCCKGELTVITMREPCFEEFQINPPDFTNWEGKPVMNYQRWVGKLMAGEDTPIVLYGRNYKIIRSEVYPIIVSCQVIMVTRKGKRYKGESGQPCRINFEV